MFDILGVPISNLNLQQSIQQVSEWAISRQTRTVTFCNAHVLALSTRDVNFREYLLRMDLNCPDGKPLVWTGRWLEHQHQLTQVAGPEFMPSFLRATKNLGLKHYFYGARPETLRKLIGNLHEMLPELQIAGRFSPTFAPLSDEERYLHCKAICQTDADIVWVGLGCPKQELWIQQSKHLLPGKILIAVGQAFDLFAGETKRAPKLLRELGFEWFYRMLTDPRRLWKRYVIYNTIFLKQVCTMHVLRPGRPPRRKPRTAPVHHRN